MGEEMEVGISLMEVGMEVGMSLTDGESDLHGGVCKGMDVSTLRSEEPVPESLER